MKLKACQKSVWGRTQIEETGKSDHLPRRPNGGLWMHHHQKHLEVLSAFHCTLSSQQKAQKINCFNLI